MAGLYYSILLVLGCATLAPATTIVPWTRLCVGEKELRFFSQRSTYDKAESICGSRRLVNVPNKDINDVIYNITKNTPSGPGLYMTGARRRKDEIWKWPGGDRVPGNYTKESIDGYANWSPGTFTNKHDEELNCMAVSPETGMWQLVNCADKLNFVCKKQRPSSDRGNVAVVVNKISDDEYNCESRGCPLPAVTWYYPNGTQIPSNGSGVYQNVSTGQSKLYVQNATVDLSGVYTCREEAGKKATATISVLGVPTILSDTATPICHTNATLRWKPNSKAAKSLHAIVVKEERGSAEILSMKITPTSDEVITPLEGLAPATSYNVKITACVSSDNCPQRNRVMTNIATKGNPRPPSSARLQQKKNLCTVSWSPSSSTASYKLTLQESLTQYRIESQVTTTEIDLSSNRYIFTPGPNKKYTASIIAIDCGFNSTKVDVIGSCRGFPQAPEQVTKPEIQKLIGDNSPIVRVKTPNESTGLISCLLVMVTTENGEAINETSDYSLDTLQKINDALCIGTTYIAAAIPTANLSTRSIRLGDGSESSCNPWNRQPKLERRRRSTVIANFTGRNQALTGDKAYRVFIISTNPSSRELLVKRSADASFHTDPDETISESFYGGFDFISFVVGFLIPTIFLLLSIIWICRLKRQLKKAREKTAGEKKSNYETIIESDHLADPTSSNTYANQAAIELQETKSTNGGYEIALAPKDRLVVEPAYESYANLRA